MANKVITAQGGGRSGLGPVKPVAGSVTGSPFTVDNVTASQTPALVEGLLLIHPVAGIHTKLIERQAIAAVSAAVAAGGTGYAVDDILTLVGGVFLTPATFRVLTLSVTAVATVALETPGSYTLFPTDPVTTSGGGGSGATLNVTFDAANPAVATTSEILLPAGVITQLAVEEGDVLSMFGATASTTVYTELAKNTG